MPVSKDKHGMAGKHCQQAVTRPNTITSKTRAIAAAARALHMLSCHAGLHSNMPPTGHSFAACKLPFPYPDTPQRNLSVHWHLLSAS